MILGLERGKVELVGYQAGWKEAGRECIAMLSALLKDTAIAIEHVGSTSIPGIHAKPIIDIAIVVRSLDDILMHRDELSRHGITFRGEDIPGQLLFVIGDDEIRTHHIHAVPWNGQAWQDYMLFRDYLISHPEKAEAYDALKMNLAKQYGNSRKEYTASKAAFIQTVIAEARAQKAIPS